MAFSNTTSIIEIIWMVIQILTYIFYLLIIIYICKKKDSRNLRHTFDVSLRTHWTANFLVNFFQFVTIIFYQKIPYWSGGNYYFVDNRIIYKLYPIMFYGPITSCVIGNIIIIFNRFFGIMYPLIYKNKWNLKLCYIFITIQIFLPLILYSYTFNSVVELIIDNEFDRSYFDIESHFSRIATNITLGIIVILSAIISLVLNLIIWIKYKKFFEVKVKDQDVVQKFSYFIYTIILSISLFIFAIQQCIRFESIFFNDQVQRNNLSLWIYWVLPFITTFQPYYLVLCSKSIRNDILHTLGISYVMENYCPKSIFTRNGTTNRTIPNKTWISK